MTINIKQGSSNAPATTDQLAATREGLSVYSKTEIATLISGLGGKSVRSGAGVPASGLGVDGDFYINTTAWSIYGPKAAGAWGGATSIVGPQGIQGVQGPAGPSGSGSGDAVVATGLQQFAATTSAQLRGVISDETGTGSLVFGIGPTLVSPISQLAALPGTDDTYSGQVLTGANAGAAIAQWDAVYLSGAGTWLLADANGSGTFPCRGLAVAAAANGAAVSIIDNGVARNDAWAWTPGGDIYLSITAGGLTQTPPSASGDKVQKVGYALTADSMRVFIGTAEFLTLA